MDRMGHLGLMWIVRAQVDTSRTPIGQAGTTRAVMRTIPALSTRCSKNAEDTLRHVQEYDEVLIPNLMKT